jgi:hypothetical protein
VIRRALLLTSVTVLLACGPPPEPRSVARPPPSLAARGRPLPPDLVLVAHPSSEPVLLGRVLRQPPGPGQPLDAAVAENPCQALLGEPYTSSPETTYEGAEELGPGAATTALLASFDLGASAERATHLRYTLEARRRADIVRTPEYDACCAEKGCGAAVVSAVVTGEGEYATVDEATGTVLARRRVQGFALAVVSLRDEEGRGVLGPLGGGASPLDEASLSPPVRDWYRRSRIEVVRTGGTYVFRDGRRALTENEVVRRYRKLTGDDDLDPIERRRNEGVYYGSGGLVLLSVLTAAWGFANLSRTCEASDRDRACRIEREVPNPPFGTRIVDVGFRRTQQVGNSTGFGLAALGTLGTVGFGILFGISVSRSEGKPEDHHLSERQAVFYATRYNRALLRHAAEPTPPGSAPSPARPKKSSLTLSPEVSPAFFGLRGTF